jgi:hypothetical protein
VEVVLVEIMGLITVKTIMFIIQDYAIIKVVVQELVILIILLMKLLFRLVIMDVQMEFVFQSVLMIINVFQIRYVLIITALILLVNQI